MDIKAKINFTLLIRHRVLIYYPESQVDTILAVENADF